MICQSGNVAGLYYCVRLWRMTLAPKGVAALGALQGETFRFPFGAIAEPLSYLILAHKRLEWGIGQTNLLVNLGTNNMQ